MRQCNHLSGAVFHSALLLAQSTAALMTGLDSGVQPDSSGSGSAEPPRHSKDAAVHRTEGTEPEAEPEPGIPDVCSWEAKYLDGVQHDIASFW